MIKDWIPRSRSFYAVFAGTASSAYYVWWDRHQSALIQCLYEQEAEVYGRQPLPPHANPETVSIFSSAADRAELLERRRLFRHHTAKLLLRAGIDWQWIEVDGAELAKKLNRLHLDDAEHAEQQSADPKALIEEIVCRWACPACANSADEQGDMKELMSSYVRMKPTLRLYAVDKASLAAVHTGIEKGLQLAAALRSEQPKAAPWSISGLFGARTLPSPASRELTAAAIEIPAGEASFWRRIYNLLNSRHQTLFICHQSMKIIRDLNTGE